MTIINQKSISGITSITTAAAGDNLLTVHTNDGTERLRIDSSGNTRITAGIVTTLTVTDTTTLNGNLDLQDNDKILIGTDDDLEIYHDGSNARIRNTTGQLWLQSDNGIRFVDSDVNESFARFTDNGAVELYYDGSKKFDTTSTGVTITGAVKIGSNTLATPNGDADNLVIDTGDVDSGLSILSATTGRIYFGDAADNDVGSIRYVHTDNSMRFETAASERLRIDSDGRLLVGASTARGNFYNSSGAETRFLVEGTTFTTSSAALVRNSNNASDAELVLAKSRGGSVGSNTVVQTDDSLGAVSFQGSDGTQFVEAASITAFVDASPGSNDMPGRLSFSITSDGASTTTERMRINKKGFMKMGPRITDSNNGVADLDSARHEFTSDDNGWTIIVTHTSGAASEHEGILIDYAGSPNGTGNSFLQGNDSNGTRFRMASNGGLYNYQSNDSNLSDEREKKNIVGLDTKWDKVKSWELKKFHYNEDADSDDLRYGVIAQQVEEHCPEVLSEWVKQEAKDAVLDGDGNVVTPAVAEVTRKGVKEQQMMWMAIKALQEAQTRIETLETQNTAQQTQINDLITRVTALEG